MNNFASDPKKTYPLGKNLSYFIRPIQTDDRDRLLDLFEHLSPQSRYLRFAHAISKLPDAFLEDILHLDYKKEMALVAVTSSSKEEIIGIARYITPPNQLSCEFSLSVRDDYASMGIGTHLMLDLIGHAKNNGLQEIVGYILTQNTKMLKLMTDLGFKIRSMDGDPDFEVAILTL